jgi:hypothetical protein
LKALFTFLLFLAALVVLPASPGQAEVYKYVDKKGTVHYTDDPDQLPEPQRSKVLRELEEKIRKEEEERRKRKEQGLEVPDERLPPPPRQPVPSGPHPSSKRLESRKASKKAWEAKAEKARERVTELEKKCEELKTERDINNRDRLTAARPGAGQRYRRARAAYNKCQKDLEYARNYLEVTLPEQARKSGVPPGWIR